MMQVYQTVLIPSICDSARLNNTKLWQSVKGIDPIDRDCIIDAIIWLVKLNSSHMHVQNTYHHLLLLLRRSSN